MSAPSGPAPEAPTSAEMRAATLAAVAVAPLVALPAFSALHGTGAERVPIAPFLAASVAAFTAGVALTCRFRAYPSSPLISAAALGALSVASIAGDAETKLFALAIGLASAFPAASLALRDWRMPIHAGFALGTVALGVETIVASTSAPEWRPAMVLVVPGFFAAMLGSRATTVWSRDAEGGLDEASRAGWSRRAAAAAAALVVATLGALALGLRQSVLDAFARLVSPVATAVISAAVWALVQVARPLFWLADRIHVDPEGFRRLLERLRANAQRVAVRAHEPGPARPWQRLLAVAMFGLLAWALVRAIRRVRFQAGPRDRRRPEGETSVARLPSPAGVALAARRALRRELPEDLVRRWYAQALLALERREVPRPPDQTPRELAVEVARSVPGAAAAFAALTGAYEDVRYGRLAMGDAGMAALKAQQPHLLRALTA